VIGKGPLGLDAGKTDLVQSFMAIRKTMTTSDRKVTLPIKIERDLRIGTARSV
jgi:hypothetical protein